MAPHHIPLPCALALPPTSHPDANTPSPCWAPHFLNKERLMLSNPTPSESHLSPAATMTCDMSVDMLSAPIPPLRCASIWQPATWPRQHVAFESWTTYAQHCLKRFTVAETPKPFTKRWHTTAITTLSKILFLFEI